MLGEQNSKGKISNGKTRADSKVHVLGNMPIQQKLSTTDTSDKNPDENNPLRDFAGDA